MKSFHLLLDYETCLSGGIAHVSLQTIDFLPLEFNSSRHRRPSNLKVICKPYTRTAWQPDSYLPTQENQPSNYFVRYVNEATLEMDFDQ